MTYRVVGVGAACFFQCSSGSLEQSEVSGSNLFTSRQLQHQTQLNVVAMLVPICRLTGTYEG